MTKRIFQSICFVTAAVLLAALVLIWESSMSISRTIKWTN